MADYKIIYVKKADLPTTEETEAIASLKGHPGWEALMNRLRFQKAVFETRLAEGNHKSLREVDMLQMGIKCWSYLEAEVQRAARAIVKSPRPQTPPDDITLQFKEIDAFIERVGSPQDDK